MGEITLDSGGSLHWKEYGAKSGFPVFYFHGIPGSSLEPKLADNIATDLGLRLIAPDLPGIGGSGLQHDFKLLDWPGMITQLADKLGLDQFSILGFSGGGAFALACASQLQQRVKHLSLVGSAASFETEVMQKHVNDSFKQLYDLPINDYQKAIELFVNLATSTEAFVQVILAPFSGHDQKIFADPDVYTNYTESYAFVLKQGVEGIVSSIRAIRLPWEFDLQQVSQPVTIWQGLTDNAINPAIGQYLADTLPDASFNMVKDAGHFLHFSNWRNVLEPIKSHSS